jgi:hypothetical protein
VPLKDHLERAADETVVIVQIEDTEAVPRSPEILAVDGVDGVLIGATDLSISLGHSGAADHPEVIAAIGAIAEAAQRAGVSVAAVVASAADAKAACARGVSAAVFVSTLLIRDALRAAVAPNPAGAAVAPDPAGGTTGVEPLVLLPGMLGTAALWEEVAPALLGAARPQFGRIDLDNSIEEMAESALATAPERFALAAHSLGAIVALAVVRRAPHRVTRLALLNASARPPSPAQLEGWRALEVRIDAGDFGGLWTSRDKTCLSLAGATPRWSRESRRWRPRWAPAGCSASSPLSVPGPMAVRILLRSAAPL